MKEKPNLVLDIAGVIATNFSPIFWKDISTKFGVSYDNLLKFRTNIREELWSGKINEQEFWDKLVGSFPTIDQRYATNKLLSLIKPLPAYEEIAMWSTYSNIHLLSNHRREWIKHIIRPVENYITSTTISSDVGTCKPEGNIYLRVNSEFKSNANVIFVDDQEKT